LHRLDHRAEHRCELVVGILTQIEPRVVAGGELAADPAGPTEPAHVGRSQGCRELLEQWPVVLERALGPVAPVHRQHLELTPGHGGGQAGDVGDVELRDPGELL